jgi:hypothetical protein
MRAKARVMPARMPKSWAFEKAARVGKAAAPGPSRGAAQKLQPVGHRQGVADGAQPGREQGEGEDGAAE